MDCKCPCHPVGLSICPECYPQHGCSLRQWKNLYESHYESANKPLFLKSLQTKRRQLQQELESLDKKISQLVQSQ